MTTNTTKVVIYTCVNKEHDGLDTQLQALRAYCEANGKEIYAEYVDECVSGISMEDGLSLQCLLEDAEKQEFQEIIVWKLNRLARNLLNVTRIISKLDNCGVTFRSITENIESSTPSGKFALQMMGAVAELELENWKGDYHDHHVR